MEPLWKLLGVTQGLTAVIGSGGKTSLLYELAEELRPCGTVLLATTTHIMKPPQYPFAETAEQLSAALAAEGVACAGSFTPEGKLTAPDFDGWQQAADFVLVEADGSKRLPQNDRNRGSQRHVHHGRRIEKRVGNAQSRHHIRSCARIALHQHRLSGRPKRLVDQKRRPRDKDPLCQAAGNPRGPV